MAAVEEAGYEIVDDVLREEECVAIIERLAEPGVERSRAGARHLLALPAIARLANDERLLSMVRATLGDGAIPFRVTLFDKSADANWSVAWHQDTALPLRERFEAPGWGPWSTKGGVSYAHAPAAALERILAVRVHLDASTPSNGPLRVVPGSHRLGVLSDDDVAAIAHSTPAAECLIKRGGVLVMRPLLIHSSTRATSPAPRRVLHVEYAESLQIAGGIALATA